jgi:penicillin V acylase-like amidase (Ntn superfamily)
MSPPSNFGIVLEVTFNLNFLGNFMKFNKLLGAITAAFIALTPIGNAFACTSLIISDANGNYYQGRTMEFSAKIPTNLTYLPAGYKIVSATPDNKQAMIFNTKYPVLGMTLDAVPNAKQSTLVEGANDQGLTFSLNAFYDFTSAPWTAMPTTTNASKILSGADFGNWVVGNFKSVAEVKTALAGIDGQIWLPVIQMMGNVPVPGHYAIYDKTGGALVVEFVNNKMNVYDNPVGVLTNGPAFPWHLTNLSNYTFNNVDKNTAQLGKLKINSTDSGNALQALPSAQTSPGRFVKAAFYANYVEKGKTPDQAILQLSHIMNNFDRPTGLTMDPPGSFGDGPPGTSASSEVTWWTVMNDTSKNLFYVRSKNSLNWTVLDFAKLKGVTQKKTISTYDVDKLGADASNLFIN